MKKGNPSMPEKVLVVPTSCLWGRIAYVEKGLITEGIEQITTLATRCGVFVDRPAAEADPSFKQIIPYAVVHHADRYLLLQRKTAQSEQRLHNKFSIGVGGHINPSELPPDSDVILAGLAREIDEELYIASG